MPSYLPTDTTPSDVDDFGIGYGAKAKGVDQSQLDAKPNLTLGPASQLPDGGLPVQGASDLPTETRTEETTSYSFGNPLCRMDTVVDNSTPVQLIHETGMKKPASTSIRGLALTLRGSNA